MDWLRSQLCAFLLLLFVTTQSTDRDATVPLTGQKAFLDSIFLLPSTGTKYAQEVAASCSPILRRACRFQYDHPIQAWSTGLSVSAEPFHRHVTCPQPVSLDH